MPSRIQYLRHWLSDIDREWYKAQAAGNSQAVSKLGGDKVRLQRCLAAARKLPYARTLRFPVRWSVGSPCPVFMASGTQAVLGFFVEENAIIDEGAAGFVGPAPDDPGFAIVLFRHCFYSQFGDPDENSQNAHYLAGNGLEWYRAQTVHNSPLLAETIRREREHRDVRPGSGWCSRHHFAFWFHDDALECIAAGYKVQVFGGTYDDLLPEAFATLRTGKLAAER